MANIVSIRSIKLRRRPIVGGGERVPVGSTDITGILELIEGRYKPITRIETTRN
jgi:hypothetical protein